VGGEGHGLLVGLALIFGVASTALGANGDFFKLGKMNVASAVSTLVKQGSGPALSLDVGANQPPLRVDSSRKVAKLNADLLDGTDSAGFLSSEIYTVTASRDTPASTISSGRVSCDTGDLAISGGFSGVDSTSHVQSSARDAGLEHVWVVTVQTSPTQADTYNVQAVCAD
jgi:hypothetical protein